jgi:hypothetical protein
MILQALADPRQMMQHRNAQRGEVIPRPHARKHQQLRRIDRAPAQDHLSSRSDHTQLAILAKYYAHRTRAIEYDLLGQRMRNDTHIRSLHGRSQIADRCRASPPVPRRGLMVPNALLSGAIEVIVPRDAAIHSAFYERLANRVVLRHILA